ncbi:hypothetical protein DZC76_11240 [Pseudomonas sp. phDV1]|nr:hypothetical protein DZC76_11240 [Pseudomonas sp. phDV1]PPV42044.1 hypothetical protein C5L43_03715 [Pseudomonas oleovorans]
MGWQAWLSGLLVMGRFGRRAAVGGFALMAGLIGCGPMGCFLAGCVALALGMPSFGSVLGRPL